MFKRITLTALAAVALTTSTAAYADSVGAGTVSSSHNFTPTITTTSDPGTYAALSGATFQTNATGAFAGGSLKTGTLNGTLTFSETRGTAITEALTDFFTFSDGNGGNFMFDVANVTTRSYVNNTDGVSGALYVLGTVYDTYAHLTASAASLIITFNSTGGSAFSSSATLSSPPASVAVTPEPSSLILLGTGLVGAATTLVRRRRAARA